MHVTDHVALTGVAALGASEVSWTVCEPAGAMVQSGGTLSPRIASAFAGANPLLCRLAATDTL